LEVLRRIAEQDVKRPRVADRRVSRELETMLLKALARDPEQRYGSAGELVDDIGNYLAGEPLKARRPTLAYLLRTRVRKHRRALFLALLLILLALAVGYVFGLRIERQPDAGWVITTPSERSAELLTALSVAAKDSRQAAERPAPEERIPDFGKHSDHPQDEARQSHREDDWANLLNNGTPRVNGAPPVATPSLKSTTSRVPTGKEPGVAPAITPNAADSPAGHEHFPRGTLMISPDGRFLITDEGSYPIHTRRYAEAESVLLNISANSAVGEERATATDLLIRLYRQVGETDKALDLLKARADSATRTYAREHPNYWRVVYYHLEYADALKAAGRFAEAEVVLNRALDLARPTDRSFVYRWTAKFYEAWGKADQAAQWRSRAGALERTAENSASPDTRPADPAK
jgi:tetratricopeptide (TPR) repeat protein